MDDRMSQLDEKPTRACHKCGSTQDLTRPHNRTLCEKCRSKTNYQHSKLIPKKNAQWEELAKASHARILAANYGK